MRIHITRLLTRKIDKIKIDSGKKKIKNMQHHQTLNSLCLCLASFSLISLTSCDRPHKGEEDQLKEAVDTFASAYFNWHYKDALQLVASNVHQADIDSLRAMPEGATFHIKDIDYTSDSTAVAFVTVKNFLAMDTIGTASHTVESAKFALSLKYKKEKWHICLTSLPRPMKEHH